MTLHSNYNRLGIKKNVILNGNYNVWRAGLGPFTGGGFSADMVQWGETMSTGQAQASAESTLKPNDNCNYTYKVEVTTAQQTLTANEYIHFFHSIEGYENNYITGRPGIISFWVYASATGTYCLWLRDANATASYVKDFTINSANTWEYKTIRVTFDAVVGDWNTLNGRGLCIGFTPCCGTTYQTSSVGQWVSGNYIASTNISNNIQKTANNLFIVSQVQLESGELRTELSHMEIEKESLYCYRYYQIFYVDAVNAASLNTGTGVFYAHLTINMMRTAPTISFTTPLMWSPQYAWKVPTSTTASASQTGRVTLIFQDTANSGYVAGNSGLIRVTNVSLAARI